MIFFKCGTNEEAPSSAFSSPMQLVVDFKVELRVYLGWKMGFGHHPQDHLLRKGTFLF